MKNIGMGTGRRKTSVARVYIRDGKGQLMVNDKDINEYFATPEQVQKAKEPLMVTAGESKYDIIITVRGGGLTGQAGACSHGIARALAQVDASNHASLKANGLLTRDSRMVERKNSVSAVQDEDSSSANVNPFSIADICSTSSDLVKIINSEGVSFVTRPDYFDEDDFDGLVGECGCPISDESLEALLTAVRIYEAECTASAYLYRAEHSRFQLELKLKKKGFLAFEINPALDYLMGIGLLDDERFARAWLNTRVISKKEGRNRLASELAQRGVSFKIVEDVLNEFFSEHSEEDICREALKKQLINGVDKSRLMRKMYRLGFSVSTVNICLEGLENITDSF